MRPIVVTQATMKKRNPGDSGDSDKEDYLGLNYQEIEAIKTLKQKYINFNRNFSSYRKGLFNPKLSVQEKEIAKLETSFNVLKKQYLEGKNRLALERSWDIQKMDQDSAPDRELKSVLGFRM